MKIVFLNFNKFTWAEFLDRQIVFIKQYNRH